MAAATFPKLVPAVLEYFTLRETERLARSLPETVRAPLMAELALAFQKREAAETLWPRGCMAEALRLSRAALEIVSTSLDGLPEEGRPEWVPGAQALAKETLGRTAGAPLPELERDVRPSDEDIFRTQIDALLSVEESAGRTLVTPHELARMRIQRVAITSGLIAFAVGVFVWMNHAPMFSHATASSQLGDYGADNAIDGDPKTIWILQGPTGWIDLTLGKAQAVGTLRIVSGNPPYNDRAAKDIHIDAFLNNAIVKSTDFTFREPPGAEPDWSTVPLGSPKCDRIRITVKSNYKISGAIAEIELK